MTVDTTSKSFSPKKCYFKPHCITWSQINYRCLFSGMSPIVLPPEVRVSLVQPVQMIERNVRVWPESWYSLGEGPVLVRRIRKRIKDKKKKKKQTRNDVRLCKMPEKLQLVNSVQVVLASCEARAFLLPIKRRQKRNIIHSYSARAEGIVCNN